MSYVEFLNLLSGLNEKTPLGKIILIRSEDDPKVLKEFTPEQKRIRNAWRSKKAKEMKTEDLDKMFKELENDLMYSFKN